MNIEKLIALRPSFHTIGESQLASLTLHPDALRFIGQKVNPGQTTLETGAGSSTVAFALCGAYHTCITPDSMEVDRIIAFCLENWIDISSVHFEIDRSETSLSRKGSGDLDFVLIDGWHSFPTAFIDWYFTAVRLKVGGLMMIDDTQLWTERTLCDFMAEEPEWELVASPGRAKVFQKTQTMRHHKWWGEQRFIIARSPAPALQSMLLGALQHVKAGDLPAACNEVQKIVEEARSLRLSDRVIANELANQVVVLARDNLQRIDTIKTVTLLSESLERAAKRHALAITHAALAFDERGAGQRMAARRHAAMALSMDSQLIKNKGLWSVLLRMN